MADITMNAPKVEKYVGEITQIAPIEVTQKDGSTSKIVLVTAQLADNSTITNSCSKAYWDKVGSAFQVGSIAQVEVEKRVKDTTTYTTKQGEVKLHTSTGTNITGITAFSVSAYQRMFRDAKFEAMKTDLASVDSDRVQAFATFFGQALASYK